MQMVCIGLVRAYFYRNDPVTEYLSTIIPALVAAVVAFNRVAVGRNSLNPKP